LSLKKNKVCTSRSRLCLFCLHCEEKICLEASRCCCSCRKVAGMASEPSPD